MLQDYDIAKKLSTSEKLVMIIEFILILIIIQCSLLLFMQNHPVGTEEELRIRIVPHSNTASDQAIKQDVLETIKPNITKLVASMQSSNLVEQERIKNEVMKAAAEVSKGSTVKIMYDEALFPVKKVGGIVTPQAYYQAVVITLGSGRGDNWWCAIFADVCFQSEENIEEEQPTFFIWEWIKSLFE